MSSPRLPETDEDFLALTHAKLSVLETFATAVARSHPDPSALLEAMERTIKEDSEDQIPIDELTEPNRMAREHADVFQAMLVRIVKGRADRG